MPNHGSAPKPDRQCVRQFVFFYFGTLGFDGEYLSFPEDELETAADRKIDGVVAISGHQILIEHTSVDLLASGSFKKRSLDPGFLIVEKELDAISCPAGMGVSVGLRFEDAKDVPRLKRIAPALGREVQHYIATTPEFEWGRYPRISDTLVVDDLQFEIRPDVLRGHSVKLHWLSSDENFLDEAAIEREITKEPGSKSKTIRDKLVKLDRALVATTQPTFSLLIVETKDIAAEGFEAHCSAFARLMANNNFCCSEIWGIHGGREPLLLWCEFLDKGRTDRIWTNDGENQTYSEILAERMSNWRTGRRNWFRDS